MKKLLFGLAMLAVFGIVGRMDYEDAVRNADLTAQIRELAGKHEKKPVTVVVDAQGEPQMVEVSPVGAAGNHQFVSLEGRWR